MMLTLLWIVLGWLVGIVVNQLSDYLPAARLSETAVSFVWRRPGLLTLAQGQTRPIRPWLTELCCIILYAALPTLIPERVNLLVHSFYIAILILIIVIDLENKLIFDIVTYPATALAIAGSFLVTNDENTWQLALAGAVTGFVIFFVLALVAQLIYGAGAGALGGGDVKLAMMMGAMLGFHRIFFALFLGVVLGGVTSLVLLISRRVGKETALPYGQYLAIAAIVLLIWGAAYVQQYLN